MRVLVLVLALLLLCDNVFMPGISIATTLPSLLFQHSHMPAVVVAIATVLVVVVIGVIFASPIAATTISIVNTSIRSSMVVISRFPKP